MVKFFSIFVMVVFIAAAPRAEEFWDDGSDPWLGDAGLFAAPSFFGAPADDLLTGDISTQDRAFDFEALPTRFALNANSSFINVNDFDISGIMIGMTFESVRILFFREAAIYSPARRSSIIYSIPKEWRFNLDYECRLQRVFAPAELEMCINTAARKRGFLYPSEMRLERPSTGEKINVYFTSNATGNVVWKIHYSNDVDLIPGDDPKFANQRDKKILAFWQMVLEKYGPPNSGNNRWVSSDNPSDPFMTALYGELILVDPAANSEDEIRNWEDSRDRFRSRPYSF